MAKKILNLLQKYDNNLEPVLEGGGGAKTICSDGIFSVILLPERIA